MAEFNWIEAPAAGCVICNSPSSPRGFVDMIGDINVTRNGYEITGVVDMIVCGTCLEQAARYVGCASQKEVEDYAYREVELITELEKTKDEVVSERQRHQQFIDNLYLPRDQQEDLDVEDPFFDEPDLEQELSKVEKIMKKAASE